MSLSSNQTLALGAEEQSHDSSHPLRVGTTGDYRPFTHRLPDGTYEGFDIEMAERLASRLGRPLELIPTSWPTLLDDLTSGKFDMAMSGITVTEIRKRRAHFSLPYWSIGKCVLARPESMERFMSLSGLDRPEVRIGVNPGGTNQAFVERHLPRATVTVFPDNLAIPEAVAEGRVDAMVTDNVEAFRVTIGREDLVVVRGDEPFTDERLAYLLKRDDREMERAINDLIDAMTRSGELDRLKRQWLPSRPAVPAR